MTLSCYTPHAIKCFLVSIFVYFLLESLSTMLTHIWLHIQMCYHMIVHLMTVFELFLAKLAFKHRHHVLRLQARYKLFLIVLFYTRSILILFLSLIEGNWCRQIPVILWLLLIFYPLLKGNFLLNLNWHFIPLACRLLSNQMLAHK